MSCFSLPLPSEYGPVTSASDDDDSYDIFDDHEDCRKDMDRYSACSRWIDRCHIYDGCCLKCHTNKCTCHQGASPRDRQSKLMEFTMGNCSCGSAGAVGYICRECQQHRCQVICYPQRSGEPHVRVDHHNWACVHNKHVHVINLPDNICLQDDHPGRFLTREEVQALAAWEDDCAEENRLDYHQFMLEQWQRSKRAFQICPFQSNANGEWINLITGKNLSDLDRFRLKTPAR